MATQEVKKALGGGSSPEDLKELFVKGKISLEEFKVTYGLEVMSRFSEALEKGLEEGTSAAEAQIAEIKARYGGSNQAEARR